MHVLAYDYFRDSESDRFGLARTAGLIHEARVEEPNCLLFDNGDSVCGLPLDMSAVAPPDFDPADGGSFHPMIETMNRLGYDAINLGNHDFDNGCAYLDAAVSRARFPVLSANVSLHQTGVADVPQAPFPGSVLLSRRVVDASGTGHDISVGVFGVLPTGTVAQYEENGGRIEIADLLDTAHAEGRNLRAQGADIVVALVHSGIASASPARTSESAAGLVAALGGSDAVIAGHRHQIFPGGPKIEAPGVDAVNGTIHGVPVVSPGYWGSHLGVIDLDLEPNGASGWQVRRVRTETRAVRGEGTGPVPVDPGIERLIGPSHIEALRQVRRPVGRTRVPVNSYFALVAPNSAVQLIQRAKLWYVRQRCDDIAGRGVPLLSSACPFKNGEMGAPDDFTRIEPGALTMRDVADLYPFPNQIAFLDLTGAELSDWLERAASILKQITPGAEGQTLKDDAVPGYLFESVLGVDYAIDLTVPARYSPFGALADPAASRIRNLSHRGHPVTGDDRFILVTNTYRAGGGGNYPPQCLTRRLPGPNTEMREVLAAYFGAHQALSVKVDDHWRLEPAGGRRLTIAAAPEACNYLPPSERLSLMPADAPDQQGYLSFSLIL